MVPVDCTEPCEIELLDGGIPEDLAEVCPGMVPGRRLSLLVPDARSAWTQYWLWGRLSHPSEPLVRWATLATELTPAALGSYLVERDFEGVVVELDNDPRWEEPPLRGSATLGEPGCNAEKCALQLDSLLSGVDPEGYHSGVWIEEDSLLELELVGHKLNRAQQEALIDGLHGGAWSSQVLARVVSVLGPGRIIRAQALEPCLSVLLRAKTSPLLFRVLAQLVPHTPAELQPALASRLLTLWVSTNRPPWLAYQRALLLLTCAAPVPALRELQARAGGLLRGGHWVTTASLNNLFTVLEMMLPALTPVWRV